MTEKLFKKGTFDFIGDVVLGKELTKTFDLGTSGWKKTRLNLGVKNGATNTQFLSIEYMHKDDIKDCVIYSNGEQYKIKLSETTLQKNINLVDELFRTSVDLETDFELKNEYTKLYFKRMNHERKKEEEKTDDDKAKIKEYTEKINELAKNRFEFIHMKDVIDCLMKNIENIKDKKIRVTGTIKSNFYNGNNRLEYIPSRIELVPADTQEQLKAHLDFFYEKDSIDDDEKEKKMIVSGYIGETIKKKDYLYPLPVILDYTKIDTENEQHQKILKFMKDTFKITDKKQMHKIGIDVNLFSGAEIVEFDESCLTDDQKMGIELGFNTIDDFKPKGNVFGSRIEEIKLARPDLKAYPNGSVEVFSVDDLGLYLPSDDSDKTIDEVKKDTETPKEEPKKEEGSMESLLAELF